jgi:hypothetical protein
MAARVPRRSFARPFVTTISMATSACFVSSSTPPSQPISQAAPGQPENSDPAPSPPPPSQSPTIVPLGSPPAKPLGSDPEPPPAQPSGMTLWSLFKTADGCATVVKVDCPAGATCNPPPAQIYECPASSIALPATIISVGQSCRIVPPPYVCPPNRHCNPPPSRPVPCPKP